MGHSPCHQKSVYEKPGHSHPETRQVMISVTRGVDNKNKVNSPTETKQAIVSVSRRVHIKNQANSLSVKEWPKHVSSEVCIVKGILSHLLKRKSPEYVF